MSRMLEILLFAVGLIVFFSAIWIVVPAPATALWLLAVAASEWSMWIAILALSSIVPTLFPLVFRHGGKLITISLIVASVALLISLYPLVSTFSVARANNVDLSLTRYFAGVKTLFLTTETLPAETHTFAKIDGQELKLDVYLPTRATANNGASVVVVHGGSWSGGVRSDFPQWNHRLSEMGFTVFDIDYRLGPQPNYLTAVGDVKCAVAWVQQHAGEFNISPGRLAVMGRSAGAHLALLASYSSGDARLPSSCPEAGTGENIRAVVSIYAPVELLWAYDNPANELVINGKQILADFLGGDPHSSDEMLQRYIVASPTSHVNTETPPTLLIHGGHDQLVRAENLQFVDQKLTDAGVEHRALFIPYAQHGYDYNINGWGSQITEKVMLKFLITNTKAK